MLEIILLAMFAAFLALRLYSALGRRTGNEPSRRPPRQSTDPHRAEQDEAPDASEDPEDKDGTALGEDMADDSAYLRSLPDHIRQGLDDIYSADRSFRIEDFLDGGRVAYRMILEGFWSGTKDQYRPFVSDEVNDQFSGAIDARADAGLVVENKLLEILETHIDSATLQNDSAEIVLRFEGDVVAVTRDKDGKVIEGDVTDAVRMTDIWTFERNVRSSDPNWLLVETRAEQS